MDQKIQKINRDEEEKKLKGIQDELKVGVIENDDNKSKSVNVREGEVNVNKNENGVENENVIDRSQILKTGTACPYWTCLKDGKKGQGCLIMMMMKGCYRYHYH